MTNEEALQLKVGDKVLFHNGKDIDTGKELWVKGKILHIRHEVVGTQNDVRIKVAYAGGICFVARPEHISPLDVK